MVGIPVWSHCYNNHAAAYDSVRFGCEQLIHGFDIDERTMDLMAEQGTFFTPTIAFLPTVSLGAAALSGENMEKVKEQADRQMYRHKKNARPSADV